MSRSTRLLIALAIVAGILITVAPALAVSWNLANNWTDMWNVTSPWTAMGATMDSSGALFGMGSVGGGWVQTRFANQGHGWSESYRSPGIAKNGGSSATTYGLPIWTFEGDWGHTEPVLIPAGKVTIGANAAFIAQNKAAARFTVPSGSSDRWALPTWLPSRSTTTSASRASRRSTAAADLLSCLGPKAMSETIAHFPENLGYTEAGAGDPPASASMTSLSGGKSPSTELSGTVKYLSATEVLGCVRMDSH